MLLIILTLILSFYVRSLVPSSSQAQTLKPGLDYVHGEIIITFKEEYMPSAWDVSLRPPSVNHPTGVSLPFIPSDLQSELLMARTGIEPQEEMLMLQI